MVSPHAGDGAYLCKGLGDESFFYVDKAGRHVLAPPRCGTERLTNWEWSGVRRWHTSRGARFGDYLVVGVYDDAGRTFTLTDPPVPAVDAEPSESPHHRPQPWCRVPKTGWPVKGDPRTGETSLRRLKSAAQDSPDFAYLAVFERPHGPDVWGVAFTGDLPRHERELRAVWGGGLCLRSVPRSEDEMRLARARAEADFTTNTRPGHPAIVEGVEIRGLGPDSQDGTVRVSTFWAPADAHVRLSARWRVPVRVDRYLQPA